MRGKPILALLFVAIIGFVLTIPLRGTSDGPRTSMTGKVPGTPTTETPQTPEDEVTPSQEPGETEPLETPSPDSARLIGNYPRSCLSPAPEPQGSGLLAIDQGNGLEISDTTGGAPRTVDDKFPFKWSPSGRYLAAGSGTVYDANGDEIASPYEGGGSFSWAWSPISDCIIYASQDGGVSVFTPGKGATTLHDGVISRFSFSPDGGDLAYVQDDAENQEAHLWITSLATGESRRATTLKLSSDEEVVLAGWTPDGGHVLFWRGRSEALLDTGGSLFAASANGKVRSLGRVLAHRDFLASCGDDLLAVIGGGARIKANSKRVARLEVGGGTDYLTPPDAHDVSPSCSPEGDLIAVARSPQANGRGPGRLTILDPSGGVQFSSDATGFEDTYPLWGRGDAGVLFIRQPASGEGDPELWRISQTSPSETTGVTLRSIKRKPAIFRDSWGHWIDWSADQPSGVSVVSGIDES